jgi:hypothetical protein
VINLKGCGKERFIAYSMRLPYHLPEKSKAGVLKLWGPPSRGALLVSGGGGASCLYEGHIYFERSMVATQNHIFFGTLLG